MTLHAVTQVVYDTTALDWEPLERFLAAATERGVAAPCADDFMWMGRCELADGPIVHLYKNAASRRYLNIDHAGFAYRYRHGDPGAYEPFDSPLAALDHVTASTPDGRATPIVTPLATRSRTAPPGPSLIL